MESARYFFHERKAYRTTLDGWYRLHRTYSRISIPSVSTIHSERNREGKEQQPHFRPISRIVFVYSGCERNQRCRAEHHLSMADAELRGIRHLGTAALFSSLFIWQCGIRFQCTIPTFRLISLCIHQLPPDDSSVGYSSRNPSLSSEFPPSFVCVSLSRSQF